MKISIKQLKIIKPQKATNPSEKSNKRGHAIEVNRG
jgi:hypothetical protein